MVMRREILMVECICLLPFRQRNPPMLCLLLLSLDRFCNPSHLVLQVLIQLCGPILVMVGPFLMLHHRKLM
jgi:hypothetical protein